MDLLVGVQIHEDGVVTVGVAQALLKGQGHRVGSRVLVAGTGPLLLALATALASAGVEVVGVADPVRLTQWLPHASTVVRAPRKMAQAATLRARLAWLGVPVWAGWELESVTREGEQLTARLASGAPLALAATKHAVNESTLTQLEGAFQREMDNQAELLKTTDFFEAVVAFGEKRPPKFTGS